MWDKSSVRHKRVSDNGRRGTMSDSTQVNFLAFLVHRNLCFISENHWKVYIL